jgi:hypothetical protein
MNPSQEVRPAKVENNIHSLAIQYHSDSHLFSRIGIFSIREVFVNCQPVQQQTPGLLTAALSRITVALQADSALYAMASTC